MLYEIEEFLWYLLIIGVPFFLLGNLTMLLFLMDKKYEWEENHKKIRKKTNQIYRIFNRYCPKKKKRRTEDRRGLNSASSFYIFPFHSKIRS